MVIQNSEVSMTSKSSIAREMKLSVQTTAKPVINVAGIQVLGAPDKIEKTEATEDKSNDESKEIGEGEFLSSLNYALGSNGQVQEVEQTNPLLDVAANHQVRMKTMQYLLELLLFGCNIDEDSEFGRMIKEMLSGESSEGELPTTSMGMSGIQPFYVQTTTHSYQYHEEQSVEYASTGTVITGDGRKLNFNYSFSMSESFTEEFSTEYFALRECIDPLIINLDDCPTSIADQTFYFDLDGDGNEDEIHNIGKGSGFLALDRNEDGEINDGLELFGARTGDGFGELKEFDEDGNGWIDENDPIFTKLRIMTVTEKGEKELYGLKQSDVGAIFLGRIDTQFTHRGEDRQLTAASRETGIFLHEKDGHAGGVQHVDFAT